MCVCVCVFFACFFSLLFSYHFALAKLVMRRSSESAVYRAFVPNATPLASPSSSSCPPLSSWHWRVGSLSALQVLNSVTTNQNRLEIAQFALRWLPRPLPPLLLLNHFDRFNRLKAGLIVSILECKLHRLCGKRPWLELD